MPPLILDTAQAFYEFLTTDAAAASIRNTIIKVGGVAQIYYAGDVIPTVLNDAENARAAGDKLSLCLSVRDMGERLTEHPDRTMQSVMLYIYDRRRGYSNIRTTRDAIQQIFPPLGESRITLTVGQKRGILYLSWGGRAGHRADHERLQVDYDAIVYTAQVVYDID